MEVHGTERSFQYRKLIMKIYIIVIYFIILIAFNYKENDHFY